nr:chemotaxis protein CheW [uncultured Desulfuromonas sp.]
MSDEAYYKDVKVPKLLTGLINHMATVEGYREELSNLGNQWDLLTILGQMSGTGMDMTDTRLGFQRLTSELLGQLGLETLKTTVQEIGSKAQVAVDIVIRNLFERTADIGFLATDDDIRAFLTGVTDVDRQIAVIREQGELEPEQPGVAQIRADQAGRKAQIIERFQEYVAKYSVYYNIILLDPDGNVVVQLDQENTIQHSTDPLIREALNTHNEYVEAFRHTDLLASEERALIYAYRVTQTNESDSTPLGVLCLCFRFENEMEGVFKNLSSEGDWSVLSLLDKEGQVIASSDTYHIPLGAKMEIDPDADFRVTQFAGREYLATTCATKGYQGYFGLGWYGHVMIPLEHAFDKKSSSDLRQRVAPDILDAVMNDPRLFSEDLRSIPVQADHIQHELERTVWNGNVRESDAQSKVLLWNISDAGARTKMVFEKSIGNLHETVVSGILNDVQFQAALAVDIMDRNLYERANDCRWWALTSAFRSILTQPERSSADIDTMSSILAYINGLYTVYTNLFVYDLSGRILAVSNPSEARFVGTVLSEDWVRETLSLQDSQCYSVSSFDATPLYDTQHTYIYGAAITDPDNHGQCVGGIGIVFDSAPQFREMLRDSLPRSEKGEVLDGCFGVFTDRKRSIISSSDERFQVGEVMDIDPAFFTLPNGEGTSRIIPFNGYYYAVGARTSSGYREYKTNDGYLNDVIAMVFVPLAEVAERDKRVHRRREMGVACSTRDGGPDCIELATFYIGTKWLGINAGKVKEAITSEGITTVPGSHDFVIGKILYDSHIINVIDVRTQLKLPYEPFDPNAPIVVIETGKDCVGLVVDALGEIPEVCMDRVDKKKNVLDATGQYIECIIKPQPDSGSKELLVVIDPEKMVDILIGTFPG